MDDDVEHADVQDDGRLMLLRMVYTENLRAIEQTPALLRESWTL